MSSAVHHALIAAPTGLHSRPVRPPPTDTQTDALGLSQLVAFGVPPRAKSGDKKEYMRKLARLPVKDNFDEGDALEEDEEGKFTYFPMRLGQELYHEKYLVERLLGRGGFGSTWVGENMSEPETSYVAIKILETERTKHRHHMIEVEVMHKLGHGDTSHAGFEHVMPILEHFYEESPLGGVHLCLVMPLMGRSLDADWTCVLPLSVIKGLALQIAQAVSYIHSQGIYHGDLKLDNILLEVENGFQLVRYFTRHPVQEKRTVDFTLPDKTECTLSLFAQQPIVDNLAWPPKIRVCDFGCAGWISNPHAADIQSGRQKAPEVILRQRGTEERVIGWTEKVDMWSYGNLIFEMLTGAVLLKETVIKRSETVAVMLACMDAWFGPFPEELLEKCERTAEFFAEGRLREKLHVGLPAVQARLALVRWKDEPEELSQAVDLLTQLLRLDPDKRLSANDALSHAWFSGYPELSHT